MRSGIYNLMRNLGRQFRNRARRTLLVRRAQVHQALMVGHLTPYDPVYVERLHTAQQAFAASGPVTSKLQAQSSIYGALLEQSSLWAFVENFRLFGILCIICLPLVFLFKKTKGKGQSPPRRRTNRSW